MRLMAFICGLALLSAPVAFAGLLGAPGTLLGSISGQSRTQAPLADLTADDGTTVLTADDGATALQNR